MGEPLAFFCLRNNFINQRGIIFMLMSKSAYLLIRKSELVKYPDLLEDLNTKFKLLYDYFD